MRTGTILALLLTAAGVQAQEAGSFVFTNGRGGAPGVMVQQFQEARTMAGRGMVEGMLVAGGAMSHQTVTGRPLSATEEQKSTQTLGDGTVISNTTTDRFYRDSAGRTRVENDAQGRTVIVDPVAHATVTLYPETRKAIRLVLPGGAISSAESNMVTRPRITTFSNTTSGGAVWTMAQTTSRPLKGIKEDSENIQDEDLGVESLNGVLATHTRHTLTIPQGQIGNSRDIHVVNERWYSDDLQMLVKTMNSDPRFGENTYELTNFSREEPDPSLFQVPADYTIEEGRGAKAGPLTPVMVK